MAVELSPDRSPLAKGGPMRLLLRLSFDNKPKPMKFTIISSRARILLLMLFGAGGVFSNVPSAEAQGYLLYLQGDRIYHSIQLQRDACNPEGSTVRVVGPGYSAAIWLAIGDTADDGELHPLGISGQFDDQGVIRFPGFRIYVPGGFGGDLITLQLRVWDNRGGSVSSWEAAAANPAIASGKSVLIRNALVLGGVNRSGGPEPGMPLFYGAHRGFSISAACPEPAGWLLLGVAAGLAFLGGNRSVAKVRYGRRDRSSDRIPYENSVAPARR